MKAEVVAVGSELLTPAHVDTNSLFITERLNELGIELQGKSVAGDDRATLKVIVADALGRSDLLILTGGLGPTDDDLTRDVVADLIDRPLDYHKEIFEAIEKRFAARGMRTPEINRRQAMVPRGAVILPNPNGTAPGLWIEHVQKVIVLLPGPPRELKPMFEAVIQERLAHAVGATRIFRRLLRVTGRSESYVEEQMQPLYAKWLAAPTKITTTILASLGQIELHLTGLAPSAEEGRRALDAAVEDARRVLGDDLFSVNGETMQEVVGALCRSRGLRIAAAESCTGGLVMARLTEVPGSSDYVDRGVVVYSNQSKIDLLGVSPELIAEHGAVSEPVALAMAEGIRRRAGTNIGIGVTGIAGPGGGSAEKPVGTVAIAVVIDGERRVRTFHVIGGREMVKFQAAQSALNMTRLLVTRAHAGHEWAERIKN
jgi:nicotinamide-nucleotide amidase